MQWCIFSILPCKSQVFIALFKEKHFILEMCFISVMCELNLKVWFKVSPSEVGFGLGFVLWNKEVCVKTEIFSLDHGAETPGFVSGLSLQFFLPFWGSVIYEITF